MKKITFILLVCFASITANATATPLIDDSGTSGTITYNSSTYTVDNNSRTSGDIWDSAFGGYSGTDFTGYYLGTIGGNDVDSTLENLISYYLGGAYSINSEKIDTPDDESGAFSVTYDTSKAGTTDEYVAGTWSTLNSTPAVAVEFYTVKGSSEFALYYVNPALQSGDWITEHLANGGGNTPGISHISATLVPAPIPEPATMLLFGTGLVGLAGFSRRKSQRK